jgi:hypothetical protein
MLRRVTCSRRKTNAAYLCEGARGLHLPNVQFHPQVRRKERKEKGRDLSRSPLPRAKEKRQLGEGRFDHADMGDARRLFSAQPERHAPKAEAETNCGEATQPDPLSIFSVQRQNSSSHHARLDGEAPPGRVAVSQLTRPTTDPGCYSGLLTCLLSTEFTSEIPNSEFSLSAASFCPAIILTPRPVSRDECLAGGWARRAHIIFTRKLGTIETTGDESKFAKFVLEFSQSYLIVSRIHVVQRFRHSVRLFPLLDVGHNADRSREIGASSLLPGHTHN